MTPKEILQAAKGLSFQDLVYLVSQLMQLLEAQVTGTPTDISKSPLAITEPTTSTAAVGIIADLIQNPIKFDGAPLTREEIYER